MPKQLTVHNATITTAAVEVKTLTISGKQVTLAVFRQLREEQLIAEDGTLNGVPWGYVNYHPDKCDDPGHWHVVWQQGDDLLRARVSKKPHCDYTTEASHTYQSAAAGRLFTYQVHRWLLGQAEECPLAADESARSNAYYVPQKSFGSPFGFPVVGQLHPNALGAAREKRYMDPALKELGGIKKRADAGDAWAQKHGVEYHQGKVDEHRIPFEAHMAELASRSPAPAVAVGRLIEAVTAEARTEAVRRQRHRDVRTALAELPQLFIAV